MNSAVVTNNLFLAVVQKTKRQLLRSESSVNGIRSLSRSLGISDDTGNMTVSPATFAEALKENNVSLSEAEISTVFNKLDRNGSGEIDPTDFLAAFAHDLSALRRTWMQRVWDSFPKDNKGCVSTDELQSRYRADQHPDVLRGKASTSAASEAFASTFNESTNPDGAVSRVEFEQYLTGVSASTFDDETFVALLRGVWPLRGVDTRFTRALATGEEKINLTFSAHQTAQEKSSITRAKNQEMEVKHVIVKEHRPIVLASAAATRRVSIALRRADADGNGFLTCRDFIAALATQRVYFANEDVLSALDTNGDGTVDYLYYLNLLLPLLEPARHMMVERLWSSPTHFPVKDAQNRLDVLSLQRKFKAKDGDEKSAFLDAWDVRAACNGKVSFTELLEWYTPESLKFQLDKDFEALLVRQWPGFEASK